jgi:diguanylate cyclase (GGDEF)-like protein/putative nucleotidyltransferase with HDIG domain
VVAYGLVALLIALAAFAAFGEIGEEREEAGLPESIAVLDAYLALNRAVSVQDTVEDEYDRSPTEANQARFIEQNPVVSDSLSTIAELGDASDRRFAESVRGVHLRYREAMLRFLATREAGLRGRAEQIETSQVDPAGQALQDRLARGGSEQAVGALQRVQASRRSGAYVFPVTIAVVVVGIVLVGGLVLVLRRWRRRLEEASREEIDRLRTAALTDNLTGLGNNRAFYEDLKAFTGGGWVGPRLTLVMLDLEGLKLVNDTLGHQAGDERLRRLADMVGDLKSPAGRAYRLGGDEFGVLLPDATAWEGADLALTASRLLEPADVSFRAGVSSTAGEFTSAELTKRADLALVHAKRTSRTVEIYSDDLTWLAAGHGSVGEETFRGTLSAALAQAVDAKDSYTRSHCETVSAMCVLIAEELGFSAEHIGKLRMAGLLHDVGKIGIPDAILQKPGPLSEPEFDVMKSHSALGARIVRSGGMDQEAGWILHHHERVDGSGYPDGFRGAEIPVESKVILVADAFEAMTADRPYRSALPTPQALAELRHHAGTQFDPGCVAALYRALGDRGSTAVVDAVAEGPRVHVS